MRYLDRMRVLPDRAVEIVGMDRVDVVRDYCRISHIEVSLRQD